MARNETLSLALRERAAQRVPELDVKSIDKGVWLRGLVATVVTPFGAELRLLEVVGKGTFGSVYRATHIKSGRTLAAKRLHYRTEVATWFAPCH